MKRGRDHELDQFARIQNWGMLRWVAPGASVGQSPGKHSMANFSSGNPGRATTETWTVTKRSGPPSTTSFSIQSVVADVLEQWAGPGRVPVCSQDWRNHSVSNGIRCLLTHEAESRKSTALSRTPKPWHPNLTAFGAYRGAVSRPLT